MDRVLEIGEIYKDLRVMQLVGDDILVCECVFCKNQTVVREENIDHLKQCLCRKAKKLEGKVFAGSLKVIKAEPKGKNIRVLTECSLCKKVVERTLAQLQKAKSCQCNRSQIKDLTGQVFGHLTVLSKASVRSTSKQIQWVCQCDCPDKNLVLKTNSALKTGKPSCGCTYEKFINEAKKISNETGIPMPQALKKVKAQRAKKNLTL